MNQRIIELVEMLKTVPTGDNAQPFRYSINGNELEIIHLSDVSFHNFNQGNVASLLSLGMMVYIIKDFCETNKLLYKFSFSKNFNHEEVWLTCQFSPKTMSDAVKTDSLLPYLKARRTDRGPYKKEAFNFDEFNKTFKNRIKFKDSLDKDAFKIINKFETMMFDDLETFKHIEAWVRYSKADAQKTKTGMSCPNMGLDPFNALWFKLFAKGSPLNFFLSVYFKIAMFFKINVLYRLSTGFGLCVMKDTSDQSVIEMGEQIIKAWLMLTKQGFVLQPISSPTLVAFISRNRNGKYLPEYEAKVPYCNDSFNKLFGTEGEIIWMFRYGKPMKGGEKHRTLRQDTQELITSNNSQAYSNVLNF